MRQAAFELADVVAAVRPAQFALPGGQTVGEGALVDPAVRPVQGAAAAQAGLVAIAGGPDPAVEVRSAEHQGGEHEEQTQASDEEVGAAAHEGARPRRALRRRR